MPLNPSNNPAAAVVLMRISISCEEHLFREHPIFLLFMRSYFSVCSLKEMDLAESLSLFLSQGSFYYFLLHLGFKKGKALNCGQPSCFWTGISLLTWHFICHSKAPNPEELNYPITYRHSVHIHSLAIIQIYMQGKSQFNEMAPGVLLLLCMGADVAVYPIRKAHRFL